METFLFLTTTNGHLPGPSISLLRETLQSVPGLQKRPYQSQIATDVDGGFVLLTITNSILRANSLVSTYQDERLVVACFGEVIDQPVPASQQIADAWRLQGADGIRALEGCFAAVIYQPVERSLTILGDIVGQRTVRFATRKGIIAASPHDICLIASGVATRELDPVSAASVLAYGWSINEQSAYKSIDVCRPFETIVWRNGRVTKQDCSFVKQIDRLSRRDKDGIRRQNWSVIETLQQFSSGLLDTVEQADVELSAGIDSRAVLSILLSRSEASRFRAVTTGPAMSEDVQIAKLVAARTGIALVRESISKKSLPDVMEDLTHMALAANGTCGASIAASNPKIDPANPLGLRFCGDGGEIFRDYYYPLSLRPRNINKEEVFRLLSHKSSLDRLRFTDTSIPDNVNTRLKIVIEEYRQHVNSAYDVLSLFYLWERFGNWNAISRRSEGTLNRKSPFYSRKAIRLAYCLPEGIGLFTTLHRDAIRNFAPSTFAIPVNGTGLLSLMYGGPSRRLLQMALKMIHKIPSRMGKLYSVSKHDQPSTLNDLRNERLSNLVCNKFESTLTDKGSICSILLEPTTISSMISSQKAGDYQFGRVLSDALSLEHFVAIVRSIRPVEWPT